MKKVKYQYRHKNRLSIDRYVDIDLTKKFYISMCTPMGKSGLKGYVQEIFHDPFGFLLLSNFQVIFYVNYQKYDFDQKFILGRNMEPAQINRFYLVF